MKRSTLQSVNKDRFAFMFASLIGRKVVVKVRSLSAYEGVFTGATMDKGEYTIVLKYARELPSETRLSGPVQNELIIPGKEVIMMNAFDVPESGVESKSSDDRGTEFKTDVEINKPRSQARGERNLQSWADYHEGSDVELEATEKSVAKAGWASGTHDQFEVAARMGVVSTYKEDLYTTPLDYSKLTSEQRARAEKIAKEIEGGRNYSSQEEGGDGDEEAMFSAVIGTGGYKKNAAPQHPSNTETSWRSSPVVPTTNTTDSMMASSRYVSGPNTRLNALNLEPAKMRPTAPAPVKPPLTSSSTTSATTAVAPRPPPPTVAAATTTGGVSEMKSINALNLEPASIGRAAAAPSWGSSAKAATPPLTKRDFEIALAEIKTRGTATTTGGKGKGKGGNAPLSPPPGGSGQSSPKGGASGSSKFSFNPNASTFTPGGMASPPPTAAGGAPAAPAGPAGANSNTLSIAITPGGSLSGTLKNQNYDQFGGESAGGLPGPSSQQPNVVVPPPIHGGVGPMHPPPPPMMMFPMMPYGMPGMPPMMAAMQPPQMQPPPVFAPLIEAGQMEPVSIPNLIEKFTEHSGKGVGTSTSFEWVSESAANGSSAAPSSYKDILGPLPAPGVPPMMPPPMMPPMMHPGMPPVGPGGMPPPFGGMMLPPGAHPPPPMMMGGPGFPPGPYPPAFFPSGPPPGGRPPRYSQGPPGGQYGFPQYSGPPPRGGGPQGGNPYRGGGGGHQIPQSQQSSTPGGVTD